MGCDEIKPPEVPELDTSKLKGELPEGISLGDLKAPVSKSTLSDSLKGAGGLITSNAKKLGDSFSPDAIAGKIGDANSSGCCFLRSFGTRVSGDFSAFIKVGDAKRELARRN